jgi:predicted dehydrogenase
MTYEPVRVGLVGCGVISAAYLKNLCADPGTVSVVACADIEQERAELRAREFGIPRVLSVPELLGDPEVELVLNLTWPRTHHALSLAALEAGKHVFSEKPLAAAPEEGRQILEAAARHGLRVGCAPDTILGDGHQTVRRVLDEGVIGRPLGGGAWYLLRHPARWHPAPQFLYEPGAGPLFDIGVYLITALVSLLGPVQLVSGMSRAVSEELEIGAGPDKGTRFPVKVPTWNAALLQFESGASAQLLTTWEAHGAELPTLQVYGSDGVVWAPDPNGFGRSVRLRRDGQAEAAEIPVAHRNAPGAGNERGLGLREMARAIREGRAHRCSVELASHVLDVMGAIDESSHHRRHVEVSSTCPRPAPMPEVLP